MADVTREVLTKVKVDNKQAISAQKKMEDQTDATTESTIEYGSAIDGVLDQFGPLGQAVKGAITGFKNFTTGMKGAVTGSKLLTTAMKAIPIILLVTALTSLFAFLTRTQEGMDAVSDAFAAAKAVMDVVINTLANVGGGLVNILKGNFKEGISQIGNSFDDLGSNIKSAVTETLRLEKAQRGLDEKMRGIRVIQSELNLAIADNILLSRDQTLSSEEQLEAISTAQQQQNIINAQNIEFAEAELALIDERQKEIQKTKKLTDEERDARIDLFIAVREAQKKAADVSRELVNRQNETEARIEADRKKRQEDWIKRQLERSEAIQKESNEQAEAIDKLTKSNIKLNEGIRKDTKFTLDFNKMEAELTAEEIALLQEDNRKRKKAADLLFITTTAEATLGGAIELSDALEQLGIGGGKLSKALAITQTIINVARAIASALSTPPFFPVGLLAAATAATLGVVQIQKIRNTPTVSGARGGVVMGASHQMGGVQFGRGGIPRLELEGGEAVINKFNTAKFRPLLSAINTHGNKGGRFAYGGIIPKFQAGGVLENQINNIGPTIESAIEDAAPVLVLEDIDTAAVKLKAVEDIASIS